MICGSSDQQDLLEQYLEKNLQAIYSQSDVQPEQEHYSFGQPRVSGGDLRSVAASYVSALMDLPDLANSDDEQSLTNMS